jgi:hypothetical protein
MPSTEHGWPSVLARLSSPSAGSAVREAHLEAHHVSIDLTIDRVRLICCASRVRVGSGATTRDVGE